MPRWYPQRRSTWLPWRQNQQYFSLNNWLCKSEQIMLYYIFLHIIHLQMWIITITNNTFHVHWLCRHCPPPRRSKWLPWQQNRQYFSLNNWLCKSEQIMLYYIFLHIIHLQMWIITITNNTFHVHWLCRHYPPPPPPRRSTWLPWRQNQQYFSLNWLSKSEQIMPY